MIKAASFKHRLYDTRITPVVQCRIHRQNASIILHTYMYAFVCICICIVMCIHIYNIVAHTTIKLVEPQVYKYSRYSLRGTKLLSHRVVVYLFNIVTIYSRQHLFIYTPRILQYKTRRENHLYNPSGRIHVTQLYCTDMH